MGQIIFEHEFDAAVERLGGYRVVDLALETIMHGLQADPRGYTLFESEFTSFRFAVTRRVNWGTVEIEPLVVTFTIDADDDVHLQHVEPFEDP